MKNEYEDNPSNQDEVDLNVFKYLSKLRSISCLLNSVIMFFLIFLILAIFFSNYLVMTYFYKTINTVYLSQYIVYPLSDSNQNFTQTLNMRIHSIEQILFESKLHNMRIATDLVFTNDIKFGTGELINKKKNNIQNIHNHAKQNDWSNYMMEVETNSDKQSANLINLLESKFNSLSYFLFLFKGNSKNPYGIKEILIKDANMNNYLIYSKDLDYTKNVMIESYSNTKRWDSIRQDFNKYEFVDYIINDPYSEEVNLYNYLKLNLMTTKLNDKNFTFFLSLRLDCDQMIEYFNPIKDNVTLIFQHTDILSTNSSLNFLPMSEYLKSFFYYGITNNLNDLSPTMSSMILVNTDSIKGSQDDFFYLTNMKNFFRLMNYQNTRGVFNSTTNLYFNNNFFDEFFVYGGLFKNISQYYFDVDIFNQTGLKNPTYQECLSNVNITYSEIICEVINFQTNQLLALNFNYHLTNPQSYYLKNNLDNNFFKAIYFSNMEIFVSHADSNYEKKFVIYLNKINNLNLVVINMITVQEYSQIEANFVNSTKFSSWIISTVLIASSVIIFLFSFFITINSVKSLIDRISQISQIKKFIVVKDEDVASQVLNLTSKDANFDEEKISKLLEISTKAIKGSISDTEKINFIENDYFDKQLITIIYESKTKLRNVLKSIDNG